MNEDETQTMDAQHDRQDQNQNMMHTMQMNQDETETTAIMKDDQHDGHNENEQG